MMVVNIKGGNHKLYEYSARDMADPKVQTGQIYFATNVCFQLATTIWYEQEKYSKQITIYFPGEINNLSTYGPASSTFLILLLMLRVFPFYLLYFDLRRCFLSY